MTTPCQDRLEALLSRWRTLHSRGESLSPEQLCQDCPELLPELLRRLGLPERSQSLGPEPETLLPPPSPAATEPETIAPTALPSSDDPFATKPSTGDELRPFVARRESDGAAASFAGAAPPGYEILGELGRGGMGVVYKARQVKLNRLVALKMILSGGHASAEERLRFLAEGEAIAAIQHPGIVQIHDFGTHDGLPFFALEFCVGGSLAGKLNGTPLPPPEAARMVEQVARAMQAAHARGIIHRDLKPANVLLGEDGQPRVTDFGLARRDEGSGLTQTGAVMGTPSYMAPEQAAGKKEVGLAADLYALGAILYECLTGRPPFRVATAFDTIGQVIADEPAPPTQINARLPRDLETICLKCLRKEPGKRYASADDLADDLRRWLDGEPIKARRLIFGERLLKLVRRRPALVAAWSFAVLVVVLVGLGAGVTWLWQRAEDARSQAEAARNQADEARTQAVAAQGTAEQAQRESEQARRELAQLNYIRQMDLAHREWQEGNVVRAKALLQETNPALRRWEWGHVNRLCHAYLLDWKASIRTDTKSVALTPDGKRLAAPGDDHSVKVWDTQTGEVISSFRVHTGRVFCIAFSPDGKRIASSADCDRFAVKVWDARTGQVNFTLQGHTGIVGTLCFSSDGQRIATGSYDNTAKVWDAASGAELLTLRGPSQVVRCVAFGPDGQRIATARGDWKNWDKPQEVQLWDAKTGKQLRTLKGHTRMVTHVVFSQDGKLLASASVDHTVKVWDAEAGQLLRSLKGHNAYVWCANFSSDGKRIVSAGEDLTVKVWDAQSGGVLRTLLGHTKYVRWAGFGLDGKRIYSASDDQTIKVWDAEDGTAVAVLRGHKNSVFGVAISPDCKSLASASADGLVKIWDLAADRETLTLKHTNWVNSVAFSPDGKRLVSGSADRTVKIWSAQDGQLIRTLSGHTGFVQCVVFSPDGRRVASGSRDKTVRVWDVESGQSVLTLQGHSGHVYGVTFSPDGKRIVSAARDKTSRVWDAGNGAEILSLNGHGGSVYKVVFSRTGQRLATAGDDATVRIWDAPTGRELRCLRGHKGTVWDVTFSPDGERVASVGDVDGLVKVWDVQSGQPILSLKDHVPHEVNCIVFSPDGLHLASGGNDRTVRVRHALWKP